MLASVASILTLAVILLSALGVGSPVLRWLKVEERHTLDRQVWSVSVGLVLCGTILGVLGLCGLLYRPWIGILTAAAAFSGLAALFRTGTASEAGRTVNEDQPPAASTASLICARCLCGLATIAGLAALVSALAPPTAGDALCYHLELPKTFLTDHRLTLLAYNDNTAFPLLVEMWYLWALALNGGVAAQLVHWAMGILFALSTVMLATPLMGRNWAVAAGAVVLLVPCVTNQMSAPLNDVALAAFTTLSLAAWQKSCHAETCAASRKRWAVIAGLMLGGALATKFTAFVWLVAVGAVWGHGLLRRPNERRVLLLPACILLLVACEVAGMWYARATWHWGNPVYPYFSEHVGEVGPEVMPAGKTPLGWDLASIVTSPWQLTMHPERFGGRGYQFGALFLACLPALAIARRLRGLGPLLAVATIYAVIWYALRQNLRFLLPIVPVLAIAATWMWSELRRFPRWPRYVAIAASAGILLAQAAIPVVRCSQHLPVALGIESRDEYLARTEPTYALARAANRLLPRDAQVLSQEYRAFYFDCHVTRESIFRRREAYDQRLVHPSDLSRVLRAAGYSHLLLAESAGGGIRYRGALRRLVDHESADSSQLACLFECRFRDSDGAARRYRVIELR